MRVQVMTAYGYVTLAINVGNRVHVHPDSRGTFLPVLRDEECEVISLANRGTARKREIWALVRAVEPRQNTRAERWIDVANLEVIS